MDPGPYSLRLPERLVILRCESKTLPTAWHRPHAVEWWRLPPLMGDVSTFAIFPRGFPTDNDLLFESTDPRSFFILGDDRWRAGTKLRRLRDWILAAGGTAHLYGGYRELLVEAVQAEGKRIHQTGEPCRYGRVVLRFEPQADLSGNVFDNEVDEGTIPSRFLPAILRPIEHLIVSGHTWGQPLSGIRVRLIGGGYHEVDSSVGDFVAATIRALAGIRAAMVTRLVEPEERLTVRVPTKGRRDLVRELEQREILYTQADAGEKQTDVTVHMRLRALVENGSPFRLDWYPVENFSVVPVAYHDV